jgi:hypothetical protein
MIAFTFFSFKCCMILKKCASCMDVSLNVLHSNNSIIDIKNYWVFWNFRGDH